MILLKLPEKDVKKFMNFLLKENTFDFLDIRNFVLQSFVRFDIDGAKEQERDSFSKKRIYCNWAKLKPYIFNVVKGEERPRFIKAVFSYPQDKILNEYPDASALFINIIFEKGVISITTGVATKSFSLDKSTEALWDKYVTSFFGELGFSIEDPRYENTDDDFDEEIGGVY